MKDAPSAPVFTVGQVVQLRSGGPPMTVTAVERNPIAAFDDSAEPVTVSCAWFSGSTATSEHFDARALVATG